jgi:hypothetical protein
MARGGSNVVLRRPRVSPAMYFLVSDAGVKNTASRIPEAVACQPRQHKNGSCTSWRY